MGVTIGNQAKKNFRFYQRVTIRALSTTLYELRFVMHGGATKRPARFCIFRYAAVNLS